MIEYLINLKNEILERNYFYNKKNLTFDVTNPNKEETELLYDVGILSYVNGKEKFQNYNPNCNLPGFIFDFNKKKYFQILNITGGRNKRFNLFLKDLNNPKIIRTKDANLEDELLNLIKSKYYKNK